MPDAAAVPPVAGSGDAARVAARDASSPTATTGALHGLAGALPAGGLPAGGAPAAYRAAQAMPARISLCFARTELGDRQVRDNPTVLPLHVARLLLLFEGPQTAEDLRRMIDAPWLPEALIELERRRLIHRITPQLPQPRDPSFDVTRLAAATARAAVTGDAPGFALGALALDGSMPASPSNPAAGDPGLDRRRALTRVMFLRLLGSLGSDMARRIDQCRSVEELDELMPQVDALIEAIAGRDALGEFRQQTTRSS